MASVTTFYSILWMLMVGNVIAYPLNDEDSSEYGVLPGKVATNCSCGWANKPTRRIIGGKDAGEHEYPAMVGVIAPTGSYVENNLVCGGTLITRRHIVTAAHCVHTISGVPLKPEQLRFVLGAHRLSKINYDDPEVMRKAERFIAHPKYDKTITSYDLAIVVLEKPVVYSNIIGPACMPTARMYPVGKRLTAIGWGFMDFKATKPDALQKVRINVVSPTYCYSYQQFNREEGFQYCTHQGDQTGQCVGDSGGPILWRDPDTNRYTLLAAPSFSKPGCVLQPAVVSDITYYIPWIQKVISETYPDEQTCSKVQKPEDNHGWIFPDQDNGGMVFPDD
uniref:Venom s1 protease 37 n=1 Tax=Pristhesancus plagipennis TaxID=1955184 RepID=A0A1Q1NPH8_PRIPG|nr:venom s1 protease 37 [Pristhesancus plagipennis]